MLAAISPHPIDANDSSCDSADSVTLSQFFHSKLPGET